MIGERTGRSDFGSGRYPGPPPFDERAAGRPLPGRTRVPGRRRRAHPSADRRTGPQYQRAGRLQSRLEARRRAAGAPPALLDDLRGGAPADRRRHARPLDQAARSGQAAAAWARPRHAATRPRLPGSSLAARAAPPATARPTRRCTVPPASPRGCSTCSGARTGPCSAYDAPSLAVPPRPGLHIHRIGDRGDIVDDGGHFRDAYGLSSGSGCWYGRTDISAPSCPPAKRRRSKPI